MEQPMNLEPSPHPDYTHTCACCAEWCSWRVTLCDTCRAIDRTAEQFETTPNRVSLSTLIAFTDTTRLPLEHHTCDLTKRSRVDETGKFGTPGTEWLVLDPDCVTCRRDGRKGLRVTRARKQIERLAMKIVAYALTTVGEKP